VTFASGGGIRMCQIRPTNSPNCWATGAAPSMVGAVNGHIQRCAAGPVGERTRAEEGPSSSAPPASVPRRGSGATEQSYRGDALLATPSRFI
jgi:hypothetical protein